MFDHDWTLALAGGEGTRLSEYVVRRFGQSMPKQYCRLLGERSMLEHTLDRLLQLTPAARTMTVIGTNHGEVARPQLAFRSDHVFQQPGSRDTGVALYAALAMIRRRDPNAIVTITPCDHYVAPAAAYVDTVRSARTVASRMRDSIVLLGVAPTEPDPDFGYISPGAPVLGVPPVRSVAAFVEKPSAARAAELIAEGALWNTMATVGSLSALWELAAATAPAMIDALLDIYPRLGTPHESAALAELYATVAPVSFSRDICERAPERVIAMALDGCEWSDWGRPERIEATLAQRASRPRGTARATAAAART